MPSYRGAPQLEKPTPPWAQSKAERRRRKEAGAMMRRVAESRTWKGEKPPPAPLEVYAGPHDQPVGRDLRLEELRGSAKTLAAYANGIGGLIWAAAERGTAVEVRVGRPGICTGRAIFHEGRLGVALRLVEGRYVACTLTALRESLVEEAGR